MDEKLKKCPFCGNPYNNIGGLSVNAIKDIQHWISHVFEGELIARGNGKYESAEKVYKDKIVDIIELTQEAISARGGEK